MDPRLCIHCRLAFHNNKIAFLFLYRAPQSVQDVFISPNFVKWVHFRFNVNVSGGTVSPDSPTSRAGNSKFNKIIQFLVFSYYLLLSYSCYIPTNESILNQTMSQKISKAVV